MQKLLIVFAVCVVAACAGPVVVEDEEGQQYYLTPVLSRQRRSGPVGFGSGGGNSHGQGGSAGFQNPNGSGGSLSYSHQNGYGHNVGVGAMVPVWSNKNRYGESTLNVGGSVQKHFGGQFGNGPLQKQYGVNFNHRF